MKVKGRIFAVDDDELIVTMLARALKKEGYEVHFQSTTKDVVPNIAAWHPDIVFLDINIDEDMNGLEILAAIRKEGIATDVVMLTGDDSAESAIRAMKLGAIEYFTKPFNIEEIKIVTHNIIENARLREEVTYLREKEFRAPDKRFIGESPVIQEILQTEGKCTSCHTAEGSKELRKQAPALCWESPRRVLREMCGTHRYSPARSA